MKPAVRGWQPFELGYCSNVHPTGSIAGLDHVISGHVSPVAGLRRLEQSSAGLWLCSELATLIDANADLLASLRDRLIASGVRLQTLNGFPYQNFHQASVKASVYRPDWSVDARLDYTLRLARILAACMPDDLPEGTISTLPLGYAPDWSRAKQAAACVNLCRLVTGLRDLDQATGRHVRVCLEMEPGCVLERTQEVVDFYTGELPEAGCEFGLTPGDIASYLGICYDVCHQAVMHEAAADSMSRICAAGITVGKIQISSALALNAPDDREGRQLIQAYAEPRYLHQVRTLDENGRLHGVMDLPEALADSRFPVGSPWRIHFHVPVQAETLQGGMLATTRRDILDVLDFLKDNPACRPHLEVETYTWEVLPVDMRPQGPDELNAGLAAELSWLQDQMRQRGLIREQAA